MILMLWSDRAVDQDNNAKLAPVDLMPSFVEWMCNSSPFPGLNIRTFSWNRICFYFRRTFKHLSMDSFESGKAAANVGSSFKREVVHLKKVIG